MVVAVVLMVEAVKMVVDNGVFVEYNCSKI